jgi:hypothetical protein
VVAGGSVLGAALNRTAAAPLRIRSSGAAPRSATAWALPPGSGHADAVSPRRSCCCCRAQSATRAPPAGCPCERKKGGLTCAGHLRPLVVNLETATADPRYAIRNSAPSRLAPGSAKLGFRAPALDDGRLLSVVQRSSLASCRDARIHAVGARDTTITPLSTSGQFETTCWAQASGPSSVTRSPVSRSWRSRSSSRRR